MKGELNLSKLSSILPFFSRKGWQKMELTLQENTGPRRLLRLYDDGKKGLVVSLVGDRDQHFLRNATTARWHDACAGAQWRSHIRRAG